MVTCLPDGHRCATCGAPIVLRRSTTPGRVGVPEWQHRRTSRCPQVRHHLPSCKAAA